MTQPTPNPGPRSSGSKPRALCFIDMPFGKKKDPHSAVEIDFDQIYETAIKPAVEGVGLDCLRGDEERTGGIIHVPMFARLLLADYVIADLTLGNPNVFYELGVRHSARPWTTIPIFATIGGLPFDVGMIRAIPYDLLNGALTEATATKLRATLEDRLRTAIEGPPVKDSPLFELIPGFPQIELPHEFTDVFRERVKYSEEFRAKLREARSQGSQEASLSALREIRKSLGNLATADRGVLVDLLLSFRDISAWDDMVGLCEALPAELRQTAVVRQQWALVLNRRNKGSDRGRAEEILTQLVKDRGADPETLGILGRAYKDKYKEAKAAGRGAIARAALDQAIDAYRRGFDADPRDYYPGINAVTLLLEKGNLDSVPADERDAAGREVERLTPAVSFAVARRGGATSSGYWDVATVLELAAISGDWKLAESALGRAALQAKAGWMLDTTVANLQMIREARQRSGATPELDGIITQLRSQAKELAGGAP